MPHPGHRPSHQHASGPDDRDRATGAAGSRLHAKGPRSPCPFPQQTAVLVSVVAAVGKESHSPPPQRGPGPQPATLRPDPSRKLGRWTESSVRDVLTNPKYTGHLVWNRRAMKTRSGKVNPIEDWVWSPRFTHPPLVSLEAFVRVRAIPQERERSRSEPGTNTAHPQAARTYAPRSFLFCAIYERRMFGKARRGRGFYVCAPKPECIPPDHPKSLWIKETYLLEPLHAFFAARIFGPDRRELLIQTKEAEITSHRGKAPIRQDPALVDALPAGRCEIARLPTPCAAGCSKPADCRSTTTNAPAVLAAG
ncbi:recombinase family protein [Streptomyces antioxidans]|nr:recombinase family protein [Streptomyces antioxidans]